MASVEDANLTMWVALSVNGGEFLHGAEKDTVIIQVCSFLHFILYILILFYIIIKLSIIIYVLFNFILFSSRFILSQLL